jgi:hypothetical protein
MRRCREIVVSVLLLGSLPLATVGAQPLSELAPGARVRIRAPGIVAGRYTGTVLSRTADTLVVASSAAAAARVPVSSLTSVEVSRGKSRSRGVLKGIAWGAPIGLAVGLLAAASLSSDPDYGGLEGCRRPNSSSKPSLAERSGGRSSARSRGRSGGIATIFPRARPSCSRSRLAAGRGWAFGSRSDADRRRVPPIVP